MLIALLATVVLAAGWMAFLRPSAVQTTTEDVTAPAQVATQAAKAAAAEERTSAATDAASNAIADPSTTTSTPAAAAPVEQAKPATEKAAAPVTKPAPKATVAEKAAKGEEKVLAEMDAGKVAVHAIDVADVGRYESVTQGVNVTQTPTTMVIERGKARTIAGLVDPTELDQLVRQTLTAK